MKDSEFADFLEDAGPLFPGNAAGHAEVVDAYRRRALEAEPDMTIDWPTWAANATDRELTEALGSGAPRAEKRNAAASEELKRRRRIDTDAEHARSVLESIGARVAPMS